MANSRKVVEPTRADGEVPAAPERARELGILNAIAEALNSAADVRQALTQTLALVAELLGLRTGWVWLLDPDTGQFYSAAAQHLPPYLQEPVRMAGRNCWCIEAFQEGELSPKNVDVMECSRLQPAVKAHASELTHGLRYHASIPLYFQDKPLGIMNVTGPSWRQLTREELRLLSTIAYQVGIAVERARLAEESTRLARTEERTRLAREIHDTLAQGLTAIALHLEGALRHLDGNPERARERLERALAMARESLEDARQSVLDLRAGPLAGKPLAEALAALARTFTTQTGVRVHVRAAGDAPLPLRVEAELFRIAQEALANVARHAQARRVVLTLEGGPPARLSIVDDGRGFHPDQVGPGCLGLVSIRERAASIEARLQVHSTPRQGTRISVEWPGPGRAPGGGG